MDEQIIIGAHHEAGHALTAYIVGWSINSITVEIEGDLLIKGITNYNYGNDYVNTNWTNIKRRIMCLLGGPIAQTLYENCSHIDLDTLGHDGKLLNDILNSMDSGIRAQVNIQELIKNVATILNMNDHKEALLKIAQRLIDVHELSKEEFMELMTKHNIHRMNFNGK